MSEIEDFEDVEIPEWEPPTRMQCKHYTLLNGKDICRHGGDLRIINDDWCIGCGKYEPGTIEAPRPEHKETMMKTEQRPRRFDWDQPAVNYFDEADGETLREYLKQKFADKPGCAAAIAMNLGVTETALRQAISRELRPRTVIRTPLVINWEAPAVDVVGNKHLVNPCRVSLINWCIDCLDEECYTREELAKLIGCKPEDLQSALNKYLGDAGDELDEEEPEAERSNLVTCYDIEEERKAREAECVKPENNIPADYTPEPGPVKKPYERPALEHVPGDAHAVLQEQPTPQIGAALPPGIERVGEELIADGQWHNTMTSAFAETAPDALSAFLRVTGQEELFRGFMLGYEARGEEAA